MLQLPTDGKKSRASGRVLGLTTTNLLRSASVCTPPTSKSPYSGKATSDQRYAKRIKDVHVFAKRWEGAARPSPHAAY